VNVVKQLAPSVDFAKMNFMTGTTATVRAKLLCSVVLLLRGGGLILLKYA
jgi:hypothetical protein